MVASVILQETLSNEKPAGGMRDYQTNCVAMAYSRVLGIGVYATVNLFVSKGWVPNGIALEHDAAVERIAAGLGLTKVATNELWSTLKPRLGALPAGRYVACNTGPHNFDSKESKGHAFAILRHKDGGWGTFANNAEKSDQNYSSQIGQANLITVWGPS